MKLNLMKFLGFETDDDYDENEDYDNSKSRSGSRSGSQNSSRNTRRREPDDARDSNLNHDHDRNSPALIMFKGIPNDQEKKVLRDAFNNGAMLLLDLHELSQRDFEEEGRRFITFMGGMAFNRGGEIEFIEPSQYIVVPHAKMFVTLPEEESQNDKSGISMQERDL